MLATQAIQSLETFVQDIATLLDSEIGLFSNGNKALWVEPGYIPANLTCNGLQVVISRFKKMRSQVGCVGSIQALQRFDWEVVFVNFDLTPAGNKKMDDAISKMEQRYPTQRAIPSETQEGRYPQIRFLIDTSRIVNLSL